MVKEEEENPIYIPSQLFFRRTTQWEIPASEAYTESKDEEEIDEHGTPYTYRVTVTPGEYDITVEPINVIGENKWEKKGFPLRKSISLNENTLPHELSFDYGPSDQRRKITIIVSDVAHQPVGGLKVYAIDRDMQRISRTAITKCEEPSFPETDCGRLSIEIPHEINEFALQIMGSQYRKMYPVLTSRFYNFAARDSNGDQVITETEFGEFSLPDFGTPILYKGKVEGVSQPDVVSPVFDAHLLFQASLDADPSDPHELHGRFEVRASTKQDGSIISIYDEVEDSSALGLELFPHCYEVLITPKPQNGFASTQKSICVESEPNNGSYEIIQIEPRVEIFGEILSYDSFPMSEVEVEATNTKGRNFSAISDFDGRFTLLVDPGEVYEMLYITPYWSSIPWSFEGDVFPSESTVRHTHRLNLGTKIGGHVFRANSESPLEDTLVEGFIISQPKDETPRLIPFGRTRSDVNGSFHLLLGPHFPL